ncbi:MAG: amidase family protein [Spirochaetes bacterium]|nr:amidase family protein [Spirochaetota bacterium]
MKIMDCYIVDFHAAELGVGAEVALEDSVMRKGLPAKAGSKILEGFIAPFDATVVTRLLDSKYNIAGRIGMNEFGLPSLISAGTNDIYDAVKAVSAGVVSYALCNDVFGVYRRRAAEEGICYLHPTYGTVSRYGLVPMACSMDQIGVACKNPDDCFGLLSVIAGNDPKDGTMYPEKSYVYSKTGKELRIGVPAAVLNQADEGTKESIRRFAAGFTSTDMELKYFDVYKQVLYILTCAEASSNLTRYDGIKFGYRASNYKNLNELYTRTRTEALGVEAKLAAIMGFMVLSQENYIPYYEKAMKIRRLIKESLRFGEYDIIVLPTKISDDSYENLSLFALAPLAGLPSLSFSFKGCGIQLVADAKNENALLTAWEGVKNEI